MAKFILDNDTKREIENKARQKAKDLAKEARELMTQEYLSLISNFYREYTPKYYYRHFNNDYSEQGILNSGMGHTFEKYYHNSHNRLYGGGIWIDAIRHDGTNRNMFDDYQGTQYQVLSSFLNGYHGVPTLGINGKYEIYNHMVQYRKELIKDFSNRLKIK